MSMELKGQDLLVLFKQAAHPAQTLTYAALGEAVLLSASQAVSKRKWPPAVSCAIRKAA